MFSHRRNLTCLFQSTMSPILGKVANPFVGGDCDPTDSEIERGINQNIGKSTGTLSLSNDEEFSVGIAC